MGVTLSIYVMAMVKALFFSSFRSSKVIATKYISSIHNCYNSIDNQHGFNTYLNYASLSHDVSPLIADSKHYLKHDSYHKNEECPKMPLSPINSGPLPQHIYHSIKILLESILLQLI